MKLNNSSKILNFVFITIILLQSIETLQGQEFQTIDPDRKPLFATSATNMSTYGYLQDFCTNNKCALGLQVDSVMTNPSSTTFNFQKLLRWTSVDPCLDYSWLGPKNVLKPDGEEYFFNGNGDTILIKSQALEGSEWLFFDDGFDLKFLATVNSVEEASTFSFSDSIKEISIRRIDDLGNTLPHIFNDKTIKISKDWGFTEVFDFYHFPMDTTLKTLIGITNQSLGVQNLTADRIFDYLSGAEFHYHNHDYSNLNFSSEDVFIRNVILDKTTSINSDTITYIIDHTFYAETYGGTNDPNLYTYNGRDTFQRSRILSDENDFDKLPFENFDFRLGDDNGYSMLVYDQVDLEWTKTVHRIYQNLGDSCLIELIADPYTTSTYKECLGRTRLAGFGNRDVDYKLVYYNKGNTTWGEPIDIDFLIPIKEVTAQNTDAFQFYPNPTKEFIRLKNHPDKEDVLVQIYTLQGFLLFTQTVGSGKTINVKSFNPGLYFTKVITEDEIYTSSFLKI